MKEGISTGTRIGSYIRRLRENYGYTLRRVEQRSQAIGDCIDNSQLSRFEKGKSFPSFEKLRILAKVFNIPVQNFSDMLDLEVFDQFKPSGTDFNELMETGSREFEAGNFGRAYVIFERCLEVEKSGTREEQAERKARARGRMAIALKKLGKLSMTETELRSILRDRSLLSPPTQIRTLLQLASVNREMGDRYLAAIISRECLELSLAENDRQSQAASRQILGNVLFEDGQPGRAVPHFEASLDLWELLGQKQKKITLLATLGECLCCQEQSVKGWSRLKRALHLARKLSDRRGAAYTLHKMAVVCFREQRGKEGHDFITRSNLEADQEPERYVDIIFANTFLQWDEANGLGNQTQAKIAFGRLKHLRPDLERRLPEVERFDEFLRRSQSHVA